MNRLPRLPSLRRMWRMSALRQALLLAGSFVIVAVIAGFVGIQIIADALTDHFDERLRATAQTLGPASATPGTPSHSDDEGDLVVGFLDADGHVLGPLPRDVYSDLGFRTAAGDEIGLDEEQWRLLVLQVDTGRLAVAAEMESVTETLAVVTSALGTVLIITVVAALVTGLLIGGRAQVRLGRMTAALDRFASGDLSARIKPGGRQGDDLDHAARQIDQALDRLQAVVEQLRHLSANLAHELKTPLARLRVSAEEAARSADTASARKKLDALVRETDAVIGVFNALLRIAQLDAGARRDRFVDVDIAGLANDLGTLYQPAIESSGRSLEVSISDGTTIQGDRDQISQMIANLLENAMAHTPPGSAIGLEIARPGRLIVWDNGKGVPPDSHGRILEPFYRVDDASPGSGLGLALVRAIADVHGAEITITENQRPEPDRPGLRVEVAFPVV